MVIRSAARRNRTATVAQRCCCLLLLLLLDCCAEAARLLLLLQLLLHLLLLLQRRHVSRIAGTGPLAAVGWVHHCPHCMDATKPTELKVSCVGKQWGCFGEGLPGCCFAAVATVCFFGGTQAGDKRAHYQKKTPLIPLIGWPNREELPNRVLLLLQRGRFWWPSAVVFSCLPFGSDSRTSSLCTSLHLSTLYHTHTGTAAAERQRCSMSKRAAAAQQKSGGVRSKKQKLEVCLLAQSQLRTARYLNLSRYAWFAPPATAGNS